MLSNAYFLAKFRFDTAENEPAKNLQNFRKISKNAFSKRVRRTLCTQLECPGWARRQRRRRATGPTPLTRSTLAACLFPPVECREWFCPSSPSAGCSEAGDSHSIDSRSLRAGGRQLQPGRSGGIGRQIAKVCQQRTSSLRRTTGTEIFDNITYYY